MSTTLSSVAPVVLFLALVACGTPIRAEKGESAAQGESGNSEQETGSRGVFLGNDSESEQLSRMVGKLAILLKTDDGTRRVRPDYQFRSGDHFRFEIAANREGWLYVMHAAPGGDWQQLWPTKAGSNKIRAGQPTEVPPRPGIFIFDNEVGNEYFYVVIRSDATPPTLGTPVSHARHTEQPAKTQNTTSKTPAGETSNFLIRDPFGETTRGVVFDPGKDAAEPYLYFSAAPPDPAKNAKIKFQLHHLD